MYRSLRRWRLDFRPRLALNALFLRPYANLLQLGLHRRPGEHGASRALTMIIVAVDPNRSYVGLRSIPRGLWIALLSGQHNRINAAWLLEMFGQ